MLCSQGVARIRRRKSSSWTTMLAPSVAGAGLCVTGISILKRNDAGVMHAFGLLFGLVGLVTAIFGLVLALVLAFPDRMHR